MASPEVSIRVLGIGGAGVNCAEMAAAAVPGIEVFAIDTDGAALEGAKSCEKILIGASVTRRMSAGGDASLGSRAVQADIDAVKSAVAGADLVIILAGLGGGTGSAASIAAAEAARDAGAKVVAFCATPFAFEGAARTGLAGRAMAAMADVCDAAVELPNDAMSEAHAGVPAREAFAAMNACAVSSAASLAAMLMKTGLINADFAALKNMLSSPKKRRAAFAFGRGEGPDPVTPALAAFSKFPGRKSAFCAKKADRLVACVRFGEDLPMEELKRALISAAAEFCDHENVIFAACPEASMNGRVEISAIGVEFLEEPDAPRQAAGTGILELPAKEAEREQARPQPARARARIARAAAANESQSEFEFVETDLKRGFFEGTPPNPYGKEDLDVPTFMRRGIKIVLKKV